MFIDEARIFVASGKGGDGMVHFRREKYVPRGGPDGGDGGAGGDVILQADPRLNTLARFRHARHHRAEDGKPGGPNNRAGRAGADCAIAVPCGTVILEEEDRSVLAELLGSEDHIVVCRGGRGGRGNARFASARNQSPRMAEKGEPGEERWLLLELRLIADAGIIGVPNAGKSTLLAALTRARPKIAAYPFTTLEPNLGVAELDPDTAMVLADIPGLIDGAHAGAGLGTAFLRHIMRTAVLIHLVDGSASDPLADYSQINSELGLFGHGLEDKPQVVAINKLDLPEVAERWPEMQAAFQAIGINPLGISGLARMGLDELLWSVHALWRERRDRPARQPQDGEPLPLYSLEEPAEGFRVYRDVEGAWRIEGKAIERAAAMTYWEYEEAVRRFHRLLTKLGIEESLRQAGIQVGDTVRIGEHELEWRE